MWTPEQVAQLTRATTDGSVRWHRSGEGRLRADDGHHTLTTVHNGEPGDTVLAESMNPPLDAALTGLWEAATASIASVGIGHARHDTPYATASKRSITADRPVVPNVPSPVAADEAWDLGASGGPERAP